MENLLEIVNLLNLLLYLLELYNLLNRRKRIIIRRWWVKPHLHRFLRDTEGAYTTLFRYFKLNDEEEFYRFTGLSIRSYNLLLNLTRRRLEKEGPRKPLQAELKLVTVLSFLHHGGNPQFFAKMFRIGTSTMYAIIKEVCTAIKEILLPIYFPPLSEQKWLEIANQYYQRDNIPHCLGAIDGRHFRLKKPANSGSIFYNYKHFFSVVLLATCDSYRRFTWFNLGDFGSVNDASIFNTSDLKEKMEEGTLRIPRLQCLPNSNIRMPFFFIGDNIFALQKHLLKPYDLRNNLTHQEKVYNYRFKRARLSIECAFGILTSKWMILQKPHGFNLKTLDRIIIALLCLHNMVITNQLEENIEEINEVYERDNVNADLGINADAVNARQQRDLLAQYFVSEEGAVPWQDQYI